MKLHPVQQAFYDNFASQCGFCSPGMIVVSKALLDHNPNPTRDEIIEALSGNVCRCTGYLPIIKAIQQVAQGNGKEAAS
jgi:carbon-monoxide dehydrogenase small subunit